jgi:hypothetical protein
MADPSRHTLDDIFTDLAAETSMLPPVEMHLVTVTLPFFNYYTYTADERQARITPLDNSPTLPSYQVQHRAHHQKISSASSTASQAY